MVYGGLCECKGLSTLATLLPFSATNCCQKRKLCCRKRQQIVAENGNILLPKTATICCQKRCRKRQQFVAVFGNNLLPICCRFLQQFVVVFGNKFGQQFVAVFGNNLLPLWTGLYSRQCERRLTLETAE